MQHHSLIARSVAVVFCLVAGIAACGDDDTSTPSGTTNTGDGSCTGARLTDDELCKLTCKTTTPSEAQAILGQPKGATSSNGSDLLDYSYSCVANNTASLISWDLYFSSGVLQSVSITSIGTFAGAALPACVASCKI